MIKGNLDITPFNIIENSDILLKEDFDSLIPLTGELKETFAKTQVFRTKTEMEVSVLNNLKHSTPASKYWQSMREQNVMFTELVNLSYEYRKNKVEILLKKEDLEKEKHPLKKELIQIEIDKQLFAIKNQERTAKDRIREIKAWSEIKEREAAKMTKEELADVDNHQLISYTKRWLNQSIEMGSNGSPAERQNLIGQLSSGIIACVDKGIIQEVISVFPEQVQQKIISEYNIKQLC